MNHSTKLLTSIGGIPAKWNKHLGTVHKPVYGLVIDVEPIPVQCSAFISFKHMGVALLEELRPILP